MTSLWEKFRWVWTNALWFLAGIILLIDPQHIYEWAHKHELWGGVITALFAVLVAWASKHRQSDGPPDPAMRKN